jgi:hypothetical protein
MNIASFDDLLQAARAQPEPQRLLFVFTGAELPPDGTPEQRRQFEAGRGGTLVPLMYVDKTPDEIGVFADLVAESREMQCKWSIVFVAALDGRDGRALTSEEAEAPLLRMIDAIKSGSLGAFIPFDCDGEPVMLQ